MAGFRFGLDPVLRQRERAEQNQQRVVAELERERLALEGRIRGWQRSITQEKDDLAARLGAGTTADVRAARVQANASLTMTAQAQEAVLLLAGVHERIDHARLELVRRSTARKALELLRDKRRAAWRAEQNRREAIALDEINTARAVRSGDGFGDAFGEGGGL